MIIWPRQARDRHRESTRKDTPSIYAGARRCVVLREKTRSSSFDAHVVVFSQCTDSMLVDFAKTSSRCPLSGSPGFLMKFLCGPHATGDEDDVEEV